MGCKLSTPGTDEEGEISRKIQQQLRNEAKRAEPDYKLLLLGAGESGKSTFAKQMKIIHLSGFSPAEKAAHRDLIHSNIVTAIKALLQAAHKMDNRLSKKNKEKAEEVRACEIYAEVTPALARSILALWNDKAIQRTMERSNEFQIGDSAVYYFNQLERISQPNYIPTDDDIIRARAKTTGISEIPFTYNKVNYRIIDVGGQRSERRKWISCFQDITACIFCVALSEYDLRLYEDESVNRMHESLQLFDEICNSVWFSRASMILFLNKDDLFKEKIKKVDLSVCFPDYTGGLNYEAGIEFIRKKFLSTNKNPDEKQIYPHVTCATDTNQIRFVFNAITAIIVNQHFDSL